jgi:hypothetical protein
MKKLPKEKALLEILEMAKIVEHQMKKIGDMITQLQDIAFPKLLRCTFSLSETMLTGKSCTSLDWKRLYLKIIPTM